MNLPRLQDLEIDGKKVSLQIWDFGGSRQFRYLASFYSLGMIGGIFMYDITRNSSLHDVNEWLKILELDARKMKEEVPMLLVGGKLDLNEERKIRTSEGSKLAEKLNFRAFFECSSRTGENVEEVFETIARAMLEKPPRLHL